jgi:hypothetical protein
MERRRSKRLHNGMKQSQHSVKKRVREQRRVGPSFSLSRCRNPVWLDAMILRYENFRKGWKLKPWAMSCELQAVN